MTTPLGKRIHDQLRKLARAPIAALARAMSAMSARRPRDTGAICTVTRRGPNGERIVEKWPPADYGVQRDKRGKIKAK